MWRSAIRDERGFAAQIDYELINPLKHGLVKPVADWPDPTYHRLLAVGVYSGDWVGAEETMLAYNN